MDAAWDWDLATGEKVVAKVDGAGIESVYLDTHLVSRSARGLKPDGHEVRRRGADAGAYRGTKDVRVFFEGEGCRLVVDGVPMTTTTSPVEAPEPTLLAATGQRPGLASKIAMGIVAMVFVGKLALTLGGRSPSAHDGAAIAKGAGRLPNTQTLRSANGLVTVHYPSSFSATDTPLAAGSSVVWLEAKAGYEKLSFFSWGRPSTLDLWKLEQVWHAGTVETWGAAGDHYVGDDQRSEGRCHGEDAAVVVRHLVLRGGERIRHWACVFVHGGHAFRFSTFTTESATPDEAYLKGLIDAVEL